MQLQDKLLLSFRFLPTLVVPLASPFQASYFDRSQNGQSDHQSYRKTGRAISAFRLDGFALLTGIQRRETLTELGTCRRSIFTRCSSPMQYAKGGNQDPHTRPDLEDEVNFAKQADLVFF